MIAPFVIPKDYFQIDPEIRRNICLDIIKQTLGKTRAGNPEEVLKYLNKVLKRSELSFVDEENYEGAQIFMDLQKVLQEEFSIHHSQDNQNNPMKPTPKG